MKKVLSTIILFVPLLVVAQNTTGTVTYTETIKLSIDLPEGAEGDEMRKMLPPEQSFAQLLYFTENASLYREPAEKNAAEDIDIHHEEEGRNMRIVMQRPQNRIYRDLENNQTIQSREFMGRFFLIAGDAATKSWKLTGEQKKILDYNCQKAVLQDTSRVVEAWFTAQIPVAVGPGEFADLPGLIMAVDIDHGKQSMAATKVDFAPLAKDALEKPTKGKAITKEEFKKMMDEKTKEMGAQGGGMRVIIRN